MDIKRNFGNHRSDKRPDPRAQRLIDIERNVTTDQAKSISNLIEHITCPTTGKAPVVTAFMSGVSIRTFSYIHSVEVESFLKDTTFEVDGENICMSKHGEE